MLINILWYELSYQRTFYTLDLPDNQMLTSDPNQLGAGINNNLSDAGSDLQVWILGFIPNSRMLALMLIHKIPPFNNTSH